MECAQLELQSPDVPDDDAPADGLRPADAPVSVRQVECPTVHIERPSPLKQQNVQIKVGVLLIKAESVSKGDHHQHRLCGILSL